MQSSEVVDNTIPNKTLLIVNLVYQSGNARLQLATNLAWSAKLTFEEICQLRPNCFNLADETVVIKDEAENVIRVCMGDDVTFFHYLDWIRERSIFFENGDWDYLLHDDVLERLTPATLSAEFERFLRLHHSSAETQLDRFSESDLNAQEGVSNLD